MIALRDKDTGQDLGSITDEQLQFLREHLEAESDDDRDYWLHRTTVEALAADGADPHLAALLTAGLGERDEFEIEWSSSEGDTGP